MAVGKGRKLKETYHIFYGSQRNIDGDEVEHFLSCIYCEHKYHVRCLKNGAADTSRYNGNWFCRKDCEKGDIGSIASKNPKELTALVEKGTAKEKSALVYQKKKTVVMERKQKKEQKEEAEKHLLLQQELQRGSWYENCKAREEKELLDRKLNADSEAQKNLEENLQQLRNRESELNSQEEQM